MNVLDRIKMMGSLPPSEQKLKNFIVQNTDAILSMEEKELINHVYVSHSTIYRFCKRLKVKGYDDLRLLLAQEHTKTATGNVNYDYPFTQEDSLETISSNFRMIYKNSIDHVFQSLDLNELKKAVTILKKANNISFITSGSNTQIAEKFRIQMSELGKEIKIASSPFCWKIDTLNLNQNDAIMINSYSGNSSKRFLEIIPDLYNRKVPIILIASTHNKRFLPYASSKLLMCDKESPSNKIYGFSSTVSALYLLDIIYAAMYQEHYEENIRTHKILYE